MLKKLLNNRNDIEFSTQSRINFLLLVVLNLLAGIVFITGFVNYTNSMNAKQEEINISSFENTTDTLTDTFGSFLMGREMITASYADYIERAQLNVEEAIDYLFVWKDYYKAIAVIDVEDYSGWAMAPKTISNAVEYNYIQKAWVTPVIESYKKGSLPDIHITEAFLDADGVSHDLAFYAPTKIAGRDYMIFFIFDTKEMEESGMNVKGLNTQNGILLDKNGKIIIGDIAEFKDAFGINFFEYLDNRNGIINSDTIKDNVKSLGKYTYIVKDIGRTENQYVCIARAIPHTDGWVYIYNVTPDEYAASTEIYKLAKVFILCLIIWIILVLIFFSIYNRIINRSFVIIEKQNEDLEYASQAKTTFVSNVSHELRTPINAVLGMNEMILKESSEDNIKEYAYDIRSAGKALLNVINNVLDFSKIESGKMEIVESEYSLSELVKDVYTLIELKAKDKNLSFIVNMSEDIPKRMIGDDVRIRQVIVNLLTNAVKYTERGTVTLRIDCERVSDDVKLLISVNDTGIGMKQEEMDRLFEEYGRLDMKRNRNTEGTGLGMPIVRSLLEMMGSEIKVESTYGVGSKFYFELVQKVVDWTKEGGLNLLDKMDCRDENQPAEPKLSKGGRVLAVDDTPLNIKVLKALLKDSGLEIDSCDGGLRALKMCDSVKYDLIFLDHRMPGMDGIETIHRLKETSLYNKETPVIALTANVVSGARESYIAEGFVDFLSKPINIEQLNAVIRKYINVSNDME